MSWPGNSNIMIPKSVEFYLPLSVDVSVEYELNTPTPPPGSAPLLIIHPAANLRFHNLFPSYTRDVPICNPSGRQHNAMDAFNKTTVARTNSDRRSFEKYTDFEHPVSRTPTATSRALRLFENNFELENCTSCAHPRQWWLSSPPTRLPEVANVNNKCMNNEDRFCTKVLPHSHNLSPSIKKGSLTYFASDSITVKEKPSRQNRQRPQQSDFDRQGLVLRDKKLDLAAADNIANEVNIVHHNRKFGYNDSSDCAAKANTTADISSFTTPKFCIDKRDGNSVCAYTRRDSRDDGNLQTFCVSIAKPNTILKRKGCNPSTVTENDTKSSAAVVNNEFFCYQAGLPKANSTLHQQSLPLSRMNIFGSYDGMPLQPQLCLAGIFGCRQDTSFSQFPH